MSSKKSKRKVLKTLQKDSTVYEVEAIVDHKTENDIDYYLVKWKGWSEADNSWVPKHDLFCDALLAEFDRSKSSRAKKSKFEFSDDERMEVQSYINEIIQPSRADIQATVSKVIAKSLSGKHMKEEDLEKAAFSLYRKQKQLKLMERKLAQELLCHTISQRRAEQEWKLQKWQDQINEISHGQPHVSVENNVDLEGPPSNFTYVKRSFGGKGVVIPEDPVIGCECSDCFQSSHCCGAMSGSQMAYTSKGKLRVPVGTPIYECNKQCLCGPSCGNRVVQNGANLKLCIFRTSDGRGWGVKALQQIRKNSFVTEYVGEIITTEEAEERGRKYDMEGRTYLFDLDFNDTDCLYTVDAAHFGNIAHFINHSCDPNLAVFAVWNNCLDINMPHLALFARRDIAAGEELTFDYCSSSNSAAVQSGVDNSDEAKNLCRCGSENCRKILFSLPTVTVVTVDM